MADVSVEFGAKDTGLEQTLKTVQAQLTSLEEEVKSGTLSFDELQQTMRKISQAEKVQEQLQAMASGMDKAGSAASAATPKVDAIGNEMKKTGNEAKGVGDKSEGGFLKMASAVAAGQSAVDIATAAIKGAFNAVKGSIDEFGAALDLGGRLSDLSERTGETAGNLLLLERAFDNSGVGADKVGQSINKLQKFIEDAGTGAAPQIEVMGRLGLTLEELAGKTPTEQMQTFAQKISDIEDPGKRAALAMEVFGRAGGELLPLLTNFSGEIGTAQDQLGGMVDVMNRNAATFDAVSDKVDIIGGKFMEFAAGVLDKVSPALDAVTEALSRIDAAAIGQKFADMFTGGISAMNGFQAAVDAFKTGNIEGALSLLWESVKLQAMQTADAIYKNLSAAFTTAGEVLGEVFRGDGPAMMVIKSAFDFIASYIKEKVAGALSEMFASMGPAFASISESLKQHAEAGATSAELALQRIPIAAELAAEDIGTVLGNAPEKFKENLTSAGSLFPDLEAQAAALAAKQEEVATAAAKHAPAIDAATNSVQKLLEEEQKKLAAEIASADAKAKAAEKTFAQIESEIELNAAIASGNQKEVERLQEKKKQEETAQKIKDIEAEIPTIIQDIIDKTGTSKDEAEKLANQLVASRIAAAEAAKETERMKGGIGGANEEAKQFKSFVEYMKEQDLGEPVKPLSEKTRDARNEIEAFGDYIGEDLDQMSFPDIAKKLGVDTVGMTGSEQIDAIVDYIKSQIPNAKQEVIDESASKEKVDDVTDYIEGQSPEIVAEVDQAALNDAVSQMQAEITNEFTGGEGGQGGDGQGGQGGTGGQGGDANADVTSLVSLLQPWQQIITAIRDRLPITALG
jgi:hypothetical protein